MSQRAQMTLLAPIAGMFGLALRLVVGAVVIDGGSALLVQPDLWFSGLGSGRGVGKRRPLFGTA